MAIDSHRRHQRQRLGGGDGRARPARGGAQDRPLHLAAPRSHRGARRHQRRADRLAPRSKRSPRMSSMPSTPARAATAAKPWRRPPTFFEVSTAIAFEIFRRAQVDVAVVEVGLGGRFDATNVLTPAITAITSIAFDHERHLGHTLSDIAFEKAGIAKPGVPLVIGRLPEEAAARIAKVAREVGAPLVDAHADDRAEVPAVDAGASRAAPARKRGGRGGNPRAMVNGREPASDRCDRHRLDGVRVAGARARPMAATVPLDRNGELLIDAAHNPAGAEALASYLQDTGSQPLPIVFAAMADKDLRKMIAALAPVAASFIATTVPHARARTADQLAAEIRRARIRSGRGRRFASRRRLPRARTRLRQGYGGQAAPGGGVRIDLHDRPAARASPRGWREPHLGCYSRRDSRASTNPHSHGRHSCLIGHT